jgi:hypothetical protein
MKNRIATLALATMLQASFFCAAQTQPAPAQYPSMAPLASYMMSEASEIALARTAAPPSISDAADVMVLRKDGYATVAKGTNGFVCIVERGWAKPTDDPEFWSPKISAPNCFNEAAAKTFLPIYLMKTKLALAGKPKAEILSASLSALETKQLPPLAPGAMCYMLSKEQYLADGDNPNWHPHLMFFLQGNAEKSWGANLPGSPIMAGDDPQERVTIFFILSPKWSDGTAAPPSKH